MRPIFTQWVQKNFSLFLQKIRQFAIYFASICSVYHAIFMFFLGKMSRKLAIFQTGTNIASL
ncbi:hypothetical protein TH62_14345 [Bacillus sp. TH008]|nr:hypothetical protein TH62_14345 [Bacillus sp. TH008]